MITGSVLDSRTGDAIAGANIRCIRVSAETTYSITSRSDGSFALPLLPPDTYRLRVEAGDKYQAQELYNLVLPVSGNLELEFRLRPRNDVLEQYQHQSVFLPNKEVLVILGPDVDTSRTGSFGSNGGRKSTLESSISNVIDPAQIAQLPLQGRDIYSMTSTQPGVATDTSIGRALGISVNGQRPSSSNYLLDGLQNNNYLTTGPLVIVAPEGIQEFRLSTNNFTAEYGGTSGFLANAVTKGGGTAWHGLGYLYGQRNALDANDFQRNTSGRGRLPMHEFQPGFQGGGPLTRSVLFGSLAFEVLRFRSEIDPQTFALPTALFHPQPNSVAAELLARYPPPAIANPSGATATLLLAPRTSLNQLLTVPRVDVVLGSKHRLFARMVINRFERPEFAWSPYPEFSVPLIQNTLDGGVGWTATITPSLLSEAKFGIGTELLSIQRPHGEVPWLMTNAYLPGSHLLYDLRNWDRNLELIENLSWSVRTHAFKFGGQVLSRALDNSLSLLAAGQYEFASLADFGRDTIQGVNFTVMRPPTAQGAPSSEDPPLPDPRHRYGYNQFALFAQDAWRLSRRLAVNYGVRYEDFGTPRITGTQTELSLGLTPGTPVSDQLGVAQLQTKTSGDLYHARNNDWSVRLGFSYALSKSGRTLARGAYGLFYDRPFDNYWLPLEVDTMMWASSQVVTSHDYLQPMATKVSSLHAVAFNAATPNLTAFDPSIQNARVQSYFVGIQREITSSLAVEVDGLGSRGINLITTDQTNRYYSRPEVRGTNPFGLINPLLPQGLLYRAGNGNSHYDGLAIQASYRVGRGQFHLAYTLSRSYDNQSDPLAGDFFNFAFSGTGVPVAQKPLPSFTTQFNPAGDWGRSDFDQRHSLAFYSLWQLPRLLPSRHWQWLGQGWTISQMGAWRSGLPFSVIGASLDGALINNRADLVLPMDSVFQHVPYQGGVKLLNPAAFAAPAAGALGNTARNQFTGPGFWSVDLAIGREFRVPGGAERLRVLFRMDAFNALNHANLNNPVAYLEAPDSFGAALYGRVESGGGFPTLVPFEETARRLQFLVKIQF
jgi:hypothetical protein